MTTTRFWPLLGASLLISAAAPLLAGAQTPAAKDAKMSTVNVCPVMGSEIKDTAKASGTRVYNGKTYYFCCAGCDTKFDAAPAKYSRLADLRSELIVTERKTEALKKEIADVESGKIKPAPAAPAKTSAAPAALSVAGPVYCAVTDEEIASPEQSVGTTVYNGKTYYFCCAGCKPKFDADKAKNAAVADAHAAKRSLK